MRLIVDTRNHMTVLMDELCVGCNNTNRYIIHENATRDPDFKAHKVSMQVSLIPGQIRHVYVKQGYITNETVCGFDNSGNAGKGNPACAEERKIGVITEMEGYVDDNFDGILGIGRIPQDSKYTNETQFIAGLVNETNKDGIRNHNAYIDVLKSKLHLGEYDTNIFHNTSMKGFLTFKNQLDDGQWGVRIEDVNYGDATNTSISLEDQYSDIAIIDTIFPGLYIPTRVWSNFKTKFIANVTGLNCSLTQQILGEDYEYCFVNSACDKIGKDQLKDIYLYFNATTDIP